MLFRRTIVVILSVAIFLLIACEGDATSTAPASAATSASTATPTESTPPPTDSPATSNSGDVTGYLSLVDALRASDNTVALAGAISQPFFAPEGRVLSVNGEDVQTFEFASEAEADTVAETVSGDGGSIGTSMVGWIAPPHFYKSGSLIVIYVGSDTGVIAALEAAVGSQFAGR